MYSYRDFATQALKRTRGKFAGWTAPMGPLTVRYAIFQNRASEIFVPRYLVTPETLARIGTPEQWDAAAAQQVVTVAPKRLGVVAEDIRTGESA